MRWLDGITDLMDVSLSELQQMVTAAMKLKDACSLEGRCIFKSRDITLPTKVHLVKAIVFPVVMYGCESWTVKKAENYGVGEDS